MVMFFRCETLDAYFGDFVMSPILYHESCNTKYFSPSSSKAEVHSRSSHGTSARIEWSRWVVELGSKTLCDNLSQCKLNLFSTLGLKFFKIILLSC